jgi:hypothetical protein
MIITVLWCVSLCSLIKKKLNIFNIEQKFFHHDDGGSRFLQNVGNFFTRLNGLTSLENSILHYLDRKNIKPCNFENLFYDGRTV